MNGYVLEGDLILSEKEIHSIVEKGQVRIDDTDDILDEDGISILPSTAKLRYRWPNAVVPYENKLKCPFESFFGTSFCWLRGATKEIEKAMKEWEKNTCIRFKKRTNERDYLQFMNGGVGNCYSNVGRIGGAQQISIGTYCRKKGIIMHEVGHALGFFHEQSRPDRDSYIEVLWDNIKENAKLNFKKYKTSEVTDQGVPYDYDSIMHYRDDSFVNDYRKKTLRVKRSSARIGQRDHLSKGDIEEMRRYYQC